MFAKKDWDGTVVQKWEKEKLYITKASNTFFYRQYTVKIKRDDGKEVYIYCEEKASEIYNKVNPGDRIHYDKSTKSYQIK